MMSSFTVEIRSRRTKHKAGWLNAGPDQTITFASVGDIDWYPRQADEGLPPGRPLLTKSWSTVSGPGHCHIRGNATCPGHDRQFFSAAGTYTLRLTASDKSCCPQSDDGGFWTVNSGAYRSIKLPGCPMPVPDFTITLPKWNHGSPESREPE